jgi:ribosomal protein S18 acetylase RimI-like enzyme
VRTAGLESIRVEVRAENRAAQAFYRKHGFGQVRLLRGYYQRVDDAAVLSKRIAQSS